MRMPWRAMMGLLVLVPAAQAQTPAPVSSPDGKVQVEVLSLKRSEGETVTLRWKVTNGGTDSFSMTPGNIRLLDIPGRRLYRPGVEINSCSTPPGQSMVCWAMFGMPPAGTKAMTVQFYEKLDLVPGVPVTE